MLLIGNLLNFLKQNLAEDSSDLCIVISSIIPKEREKEKHRQLEVCNSILRSLNATWWGKLLTQLKLLTAVVVFCCCILLAILLQQLRLRQRRSSSREKLDCFMWHLIPLQLKHNGHENSFSSPPANDMEIVQIFNHKIRNAWTTQKQRLSWKKT